MSKRLAVSAIALIALLPFSIALSPQTTPPKQAAPAAEEKWNNVPPDKSTYTPKKKAAPAPRHDISGIWDGTAEGGIEAKGPKEYVDNAANVGHDVPYTALGKAARELNKPGEGEKQFPAGEVNDPVDFCDPQGFPRMELFELRVIEILQNRNQVVYLDQFYQNFRVIWTDGRELPKDPEARWFGYASGKWVDDYTLAVDTVGMDDRTWLDNVGRPHSSDLRVHEVFHRADYDTLELTVTIDDPKFYTQPWVAMNKFVLHRLPDDYDMREFICSVSETQEYNKLIGNPAADFAHRPPSGASK